MISWIQKYFQKHFRLVFLVVLIAIGLPMVAIYSASGGSRGESIKVLERPFFNVNLDSPEQVRRLTTDGELSVFLRAGYPALQGAQLQQYALQRVTGLALADQLHLPAATPEQVAKFVPTLRAFQNESGQFDQSAYTRFADSLKSSPGGATTADVNRVLRDDVRLADLAKILGGPGYVQPVDVKLQLSRADSSWTVQVASLDYAAFSPTLNPTEDALKKFHAENAFRYDVPVRPKLSIVELKAADFRPPVAPTEEQLRAFYNANIASFPAPADADKKAAATADNFPKVRTQVEAALLNAASRRLASQVANQLTIAIFDKKLAANSPELAAYLAAQGHPAAPLAAFAPNHPPADKPWLAGYASAISRLSRERHFSDPLASPEGYVVLLWNDNLPAYTPSFLEVHDLVAADYRASEKRRLFIERGNALKAQLQAAAKTAPTGFADKAAAEKLAVKTYANFTLSSPPPDLPEQARETLLTLPAGQVSSLIGTEDKGLFVYAQEKKLPDLTPANPRYALVQTQATAMLANYGENSLLGELADAELKKTVTSPAATP
ncbi:MAG: peptidyl-prolyl cis-trans isomerase [Lacunisphaera sp.]